MFRIIVALSFFRCYNVFANELQHSFDSLAQKAEHLTFNQGVPGSSPGRVTSESGGIGRRAGFRIQ